MQPNISVILLAPSASRWTLTHLQLAALQPTRDMCKHRLRTRRQLRERRDPLREDDDLSLFLPRSAQVGGNGHVREGRDELAFRAERGICEFGCLVFGDRVVYECEWVLVCKDLVQGGEDGGWRQEAVEHVRCSE